MSRVVISTMVVHIMGVNKMHVRQECNAHGVYVCRVSL